MCNKKIEGCLKIYISYLVYSQIWLCMGDRHLPMDDSHFGSKQILPKKSEVEFQTVVLSSLFLNLEGLFSGTKPRQTLSSEQALVGKSQPIRKFATRSETIICIARDLIVVQVPDNNIYTQISQPDQVFSNIVTHPTGRGNARTKLIWKSQHKCSIFNTIMYPISAPTISIGQNR